MITARSALFHPARKTRRARGGTAPHNRCREKPAGFSSCTTRPSGSDRPGSVRGRDRLISAEHGSTSAKFPVYGRNVQQGGVVTRKKAIRTTALVMAALVAAIHVFLAARS